MFFMARRFASNLDHPFAWTRVAFDNHRSRVAIVATVNSFSMLVATCHQDARSDHTEHNDLSD